MEGLTFDTGALIALERRKARMAKVLKLARLRNLDITVPTVVVAEWWRNQQSPIASILQGVHIEPLSLHIAKQAGESLKEVGGNNTIDAIVMASAASRGDAVYTSDLEDLSAFTQIFPTVRVLAV